MNNKGDIISNLKSVKADATQVAQDLGAQIMKLDAEFSKDYDGDYYNPAIIQVVDFGEQPTLSPRYRAQVLAEAGENYGSGSSAMLAIISLLVTYVGVRNLVFCQRGLLINLVNEKGEKII